MNGPTTALSPRPFTVTLRAPEPFSWEKITEPVRKELRSYGISDDMQTIIIRHYAHLLRLESWGHGVDWECAAGQITLVVPNDLNRQEQWDNRNKRYTDGLSVLLAQILSKVTMQKLLGYFAMEK